MEPRKPKIIYTDTSLEFGKACEGDQCCFCHDCYERAKPTPKNASPSEPPKQRGRSASTKENLRGQSPSGKANRQPRKNFLKGTCIKSPCDHWHPPEVNSISLNRDSNSSISAHLHTGRLKVNKQKTEKKKKAADKGTVAMLKDARQLGFVFQDTEPLVSLSILRKSTKVLGPIRRVRFTRATQRLANIRENKGPSLGKAKVPHQRSPYAMKFEDGSQEESERQERCARGHKKILKLKETDKATFFSPTNEWCLPARGKRIC